MYLRTCYHYSGHVQGEYRYLGTLRHCSYLTVLTYGRSCTLVQKKCSCDQERQGSKQTSPRATQPYDNALASVGRGRSCSPLVFPSTPLPAKPPWYIRVFHPVPGV